MTNSRLLVLQFEIDDLSEIETEVTKRLGVKPRVQDIYNMSITNNAS